MTRELALNFQEKITKAHSRCCNLSAKIEAAMKEQLDAMRECGTLIQSAQADLGRETFREIRKACGLDLQMIQRYVRFADQFPEPIENLRAGLACMKTAFEATGLLPLRPGNCGVEQDTPTQFWALFPRAVSNLVALLKNFEASRPNLTEDERLTLAGILQPLFVVANRLQ